MRNQLRTIGRKLRGERLARDLTHLEGPHDTAAVGGQDVGRGFGVPRSEDDVQPFGPDLCQHRLPPCPDLRVTAREPKVVEQGAHVEPGTTDDHRGDPPSGELPQDGATVVLVLGDAELLGHLEDVEQVVRDPSALGWRYLGGADVHPPVDLERIGVDDLAADEPG